MYQQAVRQQRASPQDRPAVGGGVAGPRHAQLMQLSALLNGRPTSKAGTAPVQRRIQVEAELYEKDIDPRPAWGFTAAETAAYRIINNANHPVITFGSREQMIAFVRQITPLLGFFAAEFGALPSPIASDDVLAAMAQQSEANRLGHGLERHGPQVTLPRLRDRLTTGFIGGRFAPAGAQGYATSFDSHEAFLTSQMATIQHIQAAYDATANGLLPLVQTLKARIRELHGLSGRDIGAKKAQILVARNAIGTYVTANRLNAPNLSPIGMLPVRINHVVLQDIPKLGHAQADDVDALLEFFDRYKIVLANPGQIGKGLRVKDAELASPKGTVVNPAFPLAGVPESIFHGHQLQSMGAIQNTTTTVNPPGANFVFNANVSTWNAPQHFPDNGVPGWRA